MGFDPSRLLLKLDAMVRARHTQPSLTAGTQLGEFVIQECIGRGGMGEVYRAYQESLASTVAVKVIRNHHISSESAQRRFKREVKALGKLRGSENIVQPIAAGNADGLLYLAMEYVEGRSLSSVLQELLDAGQQLRVSDACDYVRQAALGIESAHQNGIIHRDIKPSNLMLLPSGRVLVLDLGLALLFETSESETSNGHLTGSSRFSRDSSLTWELSHTDQQMGTFAYASPEQLQNSHQVDARTDIYGLGATLYKLLTGETPDKRKVAPQSLRPEVPDALSRLVLQMLSDDPDKRPQSAQSVCTALTAILNPVPRYTTRSILVAMLVVGTLVYGVALWMRKTAPLPDLSPAVFDPLRYQAKATAIEGHYIARIEVVTFLQENRERIFDGRSEQYTVDVPAVEEREYRLVQKPIVEPYQKDGITYYRITLQPGPNETIVVTARKPPSSITFVGIDDAQPQIDNVAKVVDSEPSTPREDRIQVETPSENHPEKTIPSLQQSADRFVLVNETFEDGAANGLLSFPSADSEMKVIAGDSFESGENALQATYHKNESSGLLQTVIPEAETLEVSFAMKFPAGFPDNIAPVGQEGLILTQVVRSEIEPQKYRGIRCYLTKHDANFDKQGDPERWEMGVDFCGLYKVIDMPTAPLNWFQVRYFCKWNTLGNADGEFILWLDEDLKIESHTANWSDSVDVRPDLLWIGGHLSMGGNDPTTPIRQLIDEVKIIANGDPGDVLKLSRDKSK